MERVIFNVYQDKDREIYEWLLSKLCDGVTRFGGFA